MGAMDTSAATPMAASATVPMGAMDTSAATPMAANATVPSATVPMGAIVPENDRYGAEPMDARAPAARGAATTEMASGFVHSRIRA